MSNTDLQKLLTPVKEILDRGNTAEIKETKDGIIVLEVKRKIQARA